MDGASICGRVEGRAGTERIRRQGEYAQGRGSQNRERQEDARGVVAPGYGRGTGRAARDGRMACGGDPRETPTRTEQVAMSGHRGQGRAYLPAKQRGHGRNVYMLAWTLDGCTCGDCDKRRPHP